jgi:uncharacterized protein (TIGR03083 family)
MDPICDDLHAEHLALDELVAGLSEAEWSTPTPAAGWSVRDQISHLWFFDQRAAMALRDPEAFAADMQWLMANGGTNASVEPGRAITGAELLSRLARRSRRSDRAGAHGRCRRRGCRGTARRWRHAASSPRG